MLIFQTRSLKNLQVHTLLREFHDTSESQLA
jgi:hypothetical protein